MLPTAHLSPRLISRLSHLFAPPPLFQPIPQPQPHQKRTHLSNTYRPPNSKHAATKACAITVTKSGTQVTNVNTNSFSLSVILNRSTLKTTILPTYSFPRPPTPYPDRKPQPGPHHSPNQFSCLNGSYHSPNFASTGTNRTKPNSHPH